VASISRRLRRLGARERSLRATLLGASTTWGAPPSASEIDRALAYRVLMHAEIEQYLEDLVRHSIMAAQHLFLRDGKLGYVARNAIVHHQASRYLKQDASALVDLCDSSIMAHMPRILDTTKDGIEGATLGNNNGVKPKDVRFLMGILGLSLSDIDPTLLDALKVFGTERGDAAHLGLREIRRRFSSRSSPGNAPRIARLPTPSDEVASVDAVLKLLPSLDRKVQIRSKARD
jgi:hypothetical protein